MLLSLIVLSSSRLSLFFEKIQKKSSAPNSDLAFRIAGSARIVDPISESSINNIFSGFDLAVRWNREAILTKTVKIKTKGIPT
jgi:hypothetical protein